MKKGLKITGIVLGAVLLLLILLPIAFKGKIKDIVISQSNKMLNAELTFDKLGISLIRNFPYATVSITDLELLGKDDFATDTLVSADRISATMNIMSLFGDGGYEINRVMLSGVDIKAIVLEDGRANWDIMKPSQEVEQETIEEEAEFKLELKRVTIDRTNVTYDDRQGAMYAEVKDIKLQLSGDMSAAHTVMKIKTEIEQLYFKRAGIALLNNVRVGANMNIDADLKNSKFTFKDNTLSFNAIKASVDGSVAMMEGDGYDIDLKLNTEKVGFKELLSMIPAIYAKDFKSLQASGEVAVKAWAKGKMVGDNLPAFDLSIDVSNGSFRYPALPKGVDNINIAASVKSPGGAMDLVTVDVKPMTLTMGGNPFSATAHLSNLISDPAFNIVAKGLLNLGMIEEVYPMDDMKLNGTLNANIDLKGRMSYIEKEQYDKFLASGTLEVKDMVVAMKDIPDLDIKQSTFTFTPQYLNLSDTRVNIGSSDITLNSRLENYMAFLVKGQVVKGTLNINSKLLDLNELMGVSSDEEATKTAEEGASGEPMKAIKVPENINFAMNVNVGKLLYDKITLENVAGRVNMNRGKLDMSNLSFNTLDGTVVANGYYSTAKGVETPELNASFKVSDISFSKTFITFESIRKMVPLFENLKGRFSGNIALNTMLDQTMKPNYATLNGGGGINTRDLNLSGIETLDKIADAIKRPELKDINVKNLEIDFKIIAGRIHTKPFDIKMGGTNLNLSGSTGVDQTIDYTGKVSLPASTGIGKYTTVDLKMGGTFSSPTVSVDMKSMAEQAASTAISEGLGKLGEKLGVNISDAENQRQTLIDQAQNVGDKLVAEAQKQSDKLVEQAGGKTLAKIAAEVAGKTLVDEAKKQSNSLVKKATEEGDKLVERAKKGEE